MKTTALAVAASFTLAGITVAAPTYTSQSRSVFVSTGDVTDSITAPADEFGLVDVDVFAASSFGSGSFSHATDLTTESIIGSFAAAISDSGEPDNDDGDGDIQPASDGEITTAGTEVIVNFTIDTPTNYSLTLFDQTNVGSSAGVPSGGNFTSRVRLLTAEDTKFSLISRSINSGGAIYSPAGDFVGDFDQDSQSAAGTLEPGDYQFLFTIDVSAEDADVQFGLEPLVLAFEGGDDPEAIIPLPASAWAGLATLGLIGGLSWKKRRRLA